MSGRLISTVCKTTAKRGGVSLPSRKVLPQSTTRTFAVAPAAPSDGKLPPSLERVGKVSAFPNEYPGQVYAFNWCLNGDGVTPVNKAAFRITKPLDLKVAGLAVPQKMPLAVKAADASKIPEAGASDALSFADFDAASQKIRDALSLSKALYCPEGHVPGTRTAVRLITNSATLAPQVLAYLERAPRMEPPESLPITVYALENSSSSGSGTKDLPDFAGYAIEEVEVPIVTLPKEGWVTVDDMVDYPTKAKSVAAVVVSSRAQIDVKVLVAGVEQSQKALAADEVERQAKKQAGESSAA